MAEGSRCCKRAGQRFYYLVMAIFYGIIMVIELVTLGTFGVKFSQLRSHFSGSSVCVLYANNPQSPENNASCGFTLWGLVTVVLVLLVWMIFHIIMAIIGRPKITSLARVIDLIMVSLMTMLSLILSSVLTDGLRITCRNTNPGSAINCGEHFFQRDSSSQRLFFFGTLDAAKDTSWTVTILFVILIGWYIVCLVMHCCIKKYRKDEEEENLEKDSKKKSKKDKKKELPDFSGGGSPEEKDDKDKEGSPIQFN